MALIYTLLTPNFWGASAYLARDKKFWMGCYVFLPMRMATLSLYSHRERIPVATSFPE